MVVVVRLRCCERTKLYMKCRTAGADPSTMPSVTSSATSPARCTAPWLTTSTRFRPL